MYTELHLHTAFSFLDGASLPEDMVNRAKELGYTSLAITDHDGLYGAMEFAKAADSVGIKPITGAEITLLDGSHLTLLAESRVGYGNLCRLLTNIHHNKPPHPVLLEGSLPLPPEAATWCYLSDFSEGLILLTGCRQSQLARLIDAGEFKAASRVLEGYIAGFGRENVFVELQQNFVYGDTKRIERLVTLADMLQVDYVATGNVHYHIRERHQLQDVVVAIKHRATLDTSHRERRPNSEFYLRHPLEAEQIFTKYPKAIRNTELIAERCAKFNLVNDLGYTFPQAPNGTGKSDDEALAEACWEAFEERYSTQSLKFEIMRSKDSRRSVQQIRKDAKERIKEELRLIAFHKLSGFFLIYRQLLEMSKDIATDVRGKRTGSRSFLPPGRGRGSAVSSIVCYLIGLSPVDPINRNLHIGRFLNEELDSVPDIDIDFPREIREELILRVFEDFGHAHAAMVCAFATYRLRSAVRDVGKALGIPITDIERISKLSGSMYSPMDLHKELGRLPEYADRLKAPPWSFLVDLAKQLRHFPRHITQHSGGMIISATPLNEMVPIQPAAMEGRYICHWDKDSCDDAGFIKIDFLALGMLSLVEECLDLIDEQGGEPIDLSRIDFNDPAVYKMIQEGDTIGVFQIESRAQIQMIRRTKPEKFEDLVVQVAIVRPGPIIGGAVAPFIKRREIENYKPEYDHPLLENLLKETLGVIIYQDQVVRVAEDLAGFSPGKADQLRRAMTRKRSAEAMSQLKEDFLKGCDERGVDSVIAHNVFKKLEGFSAYGFPKSHAAAFALLAYQSVYLRLYHPAEFMCALLNNQPMGFYTPNVLVNYAKRIGLQMLRPDLNASEVKCTVERPGAVRVGLSFVKGLREEAAIRLVTEREQNGEFQSLADLVRRVPLRTEAVRNLIAAGALDGFGLHRREMLWQLGLFISPRGFNEKETRKYRGKQLSLALPTEQDMVELPRSSMWGKMAEEYRTLGLSTQMHPMVLLRPKLPSYMTPISDLASLPDGYRVRVPGLVVCRQRPGTARGITFLLLEDEAGLVNVVVYPDLNERQRREVRATPLIAVEGKLQLQKNNINIVAERIHPLENMDFVQPQIARVWDHDQIPVEEVDPRFMQFSKLQNFDLEEVDEPIDRIQIHTFSPEAHNYH